MEGSIPAASFSPVIFPKSDLKSSLKAWASEEKKHGGLRRAPVLVFSSLAQRFRSSLTSRELGTGYSIPCLVIILDIWLFHYVFSAELSFLSRQKKHKCTKRDTCLLITFCCRELLEESGLTVNELQEAGILKFEFLGEPEILEVHVFTTNKYEGTPTESEGNINLKK